MVSKVSTHCVTLGLSGVVTPAEVQYAYRNAMRQWHPDHHHGKETEALAHTKAVAINEAYEFLSEVTEDRDIPDTSSPSAAAYDTYRTRHTYRKQSFTPGFPDSSVFEVFVKSSNIVSTGYSATNRMLYLKFHNKSVYRYYDVPKYIFDELLSASSHGRYVNKNICQQFQIRKMLKMPNNDLRACLLATQQVLINMTDITHREQGCLLGQLAGDALGSLVEFQSAEQVLQRYPDGVLELADGGTWNTIAGQPTDDSELALLLARMLAEKGTYDQAEALKAYQYWLDSDPFDCGMTTSSGLRGNLNSSSQANGALMRIGPLGIFGANYELDQVAEWARLDAALTHPHPVCQDVNALYAMAIAYAVRSGATPEALYQRIIDWSEDMSIAEPVVDVVKKAASEPPVSYIHQQGWVLIAFQNALWQLLHARSFEEGVIGSVMRGGDTDTNACICGALLGAVYGRGAVPEQWVDALLSCRPAPGAPGVNHPRSECFWPVDVLELAERLVGE